ncbi:MAG TPA: TldD/PmbA family protein [Bryobacteraceae bacterium]|nr:TldD/PmbA family protein [Bryobacteraceae bacterium]
MQTLADNALAIADRNGVEYADVRLEAIRERHLATKNGKVVGVSEHETLGIGIRVLSNGAWGFAGTSDLSAKGIEAAVNRAYQIAEASSLVRLHPTRLAPEQPHQGSWTSPCRIDPFSLSSDEQLSHLLAVDAELRRTSGVTLAETQMAFARNETWFASTEGSRLHQVRTTSGAGCAAYSYKEDEIQKRSYPTSFGGQYELKGYELVHEWDMLAHAPRLAEEAVALHTADPCPQGHFDIILEGSQLGLQIHESIGHPIELDRVLGSEANYAGLSFLSLNDVDRLRYGSEIVNVVCDARLEHGQGLGTFAYDDEGVPAQGVPIIENGIFRGFMTSRETAASIGAPRSSGTMRADGWHRLPLIRMTNVSLLPGRQSLDEVFDADRAIYMETNKSWSIDDKRYNFQFGTEIAWEIKNGKKVRMLRNPTYSGISTEFWNSCDAIAGPEHWTLWGVPNCGKGQPEQVIGTGHGASPARFRNVSVAPSV